MQAPILKQIYPDKENSGVVDSLTTKNGSSATLELNENNEEQLVLRDSDDRILFSYEPGTSTCVVYAPSGDLELRAPKGSISIEAAEGIKLEGDVLETTFRRVRHRVDILETLAGRVVERAKETYREVEGLAQTRASHFREVAEKTFHILGTRTLIKARDDLKLKGEKIHLA